MAGAAGAGVSVVLGGASPWPSLVGVAGAAPPRPSLGMKDLTRTTFEPLVGSKFVLRQQPGPVVTVVLGQVTNLPATGGAKGEAFSLLFTGAPESSVRAGVHALEHPSIGSVPMFGVPVGRGRGVQDYEVVVNRQSR